MMIDAIVLGLLLIVLGVASYLATQRKSKTALIPSLFGVLFAGLGLGSSGTGPLATAVSVLAVVGLLATSRSLVPLLRGPRGAAVLSKASMAGLCLVFLIKNWLAA